MTEAAKASQVMLARVVVGLVIAFTIIGAIWYGFSSDVRLRLWQDLIDRPGGPMTFRVILQPLMAAIAALHDARLDASTGRSPYLWTILTSSAERGGRLREGVIATARVMLLALCMDAIYQLTVLKTFYPGEAAIVAILLAFVPYLLLRGPFARMVRWWRSTGKRAGNSKP
jgi:hypothetical protein